MAASHFENREDPGNEVEEKMTKIFVWGLPGDDHEIAKGIYIYRNVSKNRHYYIIIKN